MPALTVETGAQVSSSPSDEPSPKRSRSYSPARPPYSPITPVLSSAQLATTSPASSSASHHHQQQQSWTYAHTQPPQTFIPPPAVPTETISLDANPDALAIKAAISILQIQRQKATSHIQTLQLIKERALADPTAFAEALISGKIGTKPDQLFNPTYQGPEDDEDDDADDGDEEGASHASYDQANTAAPGPIPDSSVDVLMTDISPRIHRWPSFPNPQKVVRTPPINWTQYGIVGPSLDKLHNDQLARPNEGLPAKIGADGIAVPVEGGKKNDGLGTAATYIPGRDKLEKRKRKR